MGSFVFCSHSVLHSPSCVSVDRQPMLRKSFSFLREIADQSSPFAFSNNIHHFPTLSARSHGNRRGQPPQRSCATGRAKEGDEDKMPPSSLDAKASNLSNQKEIISLFKRIQSSISKEGSPRTKKKNLSLSKDKSIVEYSQRRTEAKDSSSIKRREKAWRRGMPKKEQIVQDIAQPAGIKLTRPPSNFVRRSPIPSPSTPREEVVRLKSEVMPNATKRKELSLPRLEGLKLLELRELAKARGLRGYSKLKKSELMELLRT